MTKFALFVRLEAKPGQEAALAAFLAGALPLANAELGTVAWFALQFSPSTFGIFDAFADEDVPAFAERALRLCVPQNHPFSITAATFDLLVPSAVVIVDGAVMISGLC